MDVYKLLAVVSPFVSAFLAAMLTYFFALKTKRFDILYANKIPAFKDVTGKLTEFKIYCEGRVAFFQANEHSPYYEEAVGGLEHRTKISTTLDLNSVFICNNSQEKIYALLAKLGILCSVELSLVSGDQMPGIEDLYQELGDLAKGCISTLYDELNLK